MVTDVIPEGLTLAEGADKNISDGGALGEDGRTITWPLGDLEPGYDEFVWFMVDVPDVAEETMWKNIAKFTATSKEKPDNPDGLTLVEGSISNGGSAPDKKNISWSIPSLGAGETLRLFFQVTVPDVRKLTIWTNIAHAHYSNNPDGPEKDIPSNPVQVQEDTSDVNILKEQSVNGGTRTTEKLSVEAGDEVTYYITVSHDGGSWFNTKEVVIKDQIPGGTIQRIRTRRSRPMR